jgi:GLPGLI family protein
MKLNTQFIVAILFSITSFAKKSGIITYYIKMPNYDINSKNVKQNDFLKKIVDESTNYYCQLDFNTTKSHFYFQKKMSINSSVGEYEKVISVMVSNGDYYYDKELKELIIEHDDKTLTREEYQTNQWVISEESKNIDMYMCYKATCTQQYNRGDKLLTKQIVAWFAPSLPFSFGPKQFNGLPGLILELTDGNITLYANKIEFKEPNQLVINLPKGKVISVSDYIKKLPEIPSR